MSRVGSGGSLEPRREEAALTPQEWLERERSLRMLDMQRALLTFLMASLGGALGVTLLIFLLEGWHLWGFDLPDNTLMWLGGATVGEIAGLLALVVRTFFGRES